MTLRKTQMWHYCMSCDGTIKGQKCPYGIGICYSEREAMAMAEEQGHFTEDGRWFCNINKDRHDQGATVRPQMSFAGKFRFLELLPENKGKLIARVAPDIKAEWDDPTKTHGIQAPVSPPNRPPGAFCAIDGVWLIEDASLPEGSIVFENQERPTNDPIQ